jgi:hypothetical protein
MSSPHVENQSDRQPAQRKRRQNKKFRVSQMQPPVRMQITLTWIRELKRQQDITAVHNQSNTAVSSQTNGQVAQRKRWLNESNRRSQLNRQLGQRRRREKEKEHETTTDPDIRVRDPIPYSCIVR